MVYIYPTWLVDFYGKCIGKYTIHGLCGLFDLIIPISSTRLYRLNSRRAMHEKRYEKRSPRGDIMGAKE